MGRKFCIALLAIAMVMFVAGAAFAAPVMPAVYDGTAVYNDAGKTPVEAGLLRAYIDDELVSKDIDPNSHIKDGAFSNFLGDINDDKGDADYTKVGKPVVFKVVIGGQEYDAIASEPVIYTIGDVRNIELTVQTVPQPKVVPALQTLSATDIATTSATLNGKITSNGNAAITEYGFKWGTNESSLTNKLIVGESNLTGLFSKNLTGLAENTTYYYQAYATNSEGTGTASEIESFKTTTNTNTTIEATFDLPELQGLPGDVIEVPVTLDSTGGIAGVELVISTCDELLTYQDIDEGSLTDGFMVAYNEQNGKLVIADLDGATIPQGTGTIAVLKFKVNDEVQNGQSCELQFSGVVLSDTDSKTVAAGNININNGSFVVITRIMGDVNGDKLINVSDVIKAVNFALEKETPTAEERYASDINGDGRISVADVVAIINLVLQKQV
ncbi:Cohesin domain protein [Sporotomaculum syntrophicum]|uniref:Cohesin domain protein n=1 Tax=Sporotomaculum syntrophicum TaxID=182264 RepID=A0A9D2WRZ9_9FIRM|nr:dockerin type I domain-containing protein [Sporotomaculum syntrophicum]KAF1086045.1 Cohesin domain protein [Sporotomaculum syntrophicum]